MMGRYNNDGVVPKRISRPVESARGRVACGVGAVYLGTRRTQTGTGSEKATHQPALYTAVFIRVYHHHHLTKKYCYYYHYYCYYNGGGGGVDDDYGDDDDDDDDDNRGASVKWCVYNTVSTIMDNPFVAHATPRR